MNCAKCGNEINDTYRFCPKCGAEVEQPQNKAEHDSDIKEIQSELNKLVKKEKEAQADTEKRINEDLQIKEASAENENAEKAEESEKNDLQDLVIPEKTENESPKKPKFGLTDKAKKYIIIAGSAAAAVALILVLIFAVIIPASLPKVYASKYITVSFDSESEFNGTISGTITIDKEAIERDYADDNAVSAARLGSLDRMLSELRLEYSVEDKDKTNWDTGFVRFRGLDMDDVLNLELSWEDDENAKKVISTEEMVCGLRFEKAPSSLKLNIGDYIKEQGIEIKEPIELNILDYIGDNNLVITIPGDDTPLSVGIDRFETEIGGYTVSKEGFFEPAIRVFDKSGDFLTSVYFDFTYDGEISEGDTVKLDYSTDNTPATGKGFLLTGKPVEYTVAKYEELTADSVKNHLDSVKNYIADNLSDSDKDIAENDKTEINAVYFVGNGDYMMNGRIVAVYTNSTKNYSRIIELITDGYFSGDRFVFFGYTNIGEKAKNADNAFKAYEKNHGDSPDYSAEKLG